MTQFNKTTLLIPILLATGVFAYLYKKSQPEESAPRIEDAAPVPEIQVKASEVRKGASFQAFDYHLNPGQAYEVQFKREVSGKSQKKPGENGTFVDTKSEGRLLIHSVRYADSRISAVVQMRFTKIDNPLFDFSIAHEFGILKSPQKLNPGKEGEAVSKFKNALLFELTATGRILKIFRAEAGMSDEGVILSSDIVGAVLYQWPPDFTAAGPHPVKKTHTDEHGTKYDITYRISKGAGGTLNINGESLQDPEAGQKASAPAGGMRPVTSRQLTAQWDEKSGLPMSLKNMIQQEIKAQSQTIASATTLIDSSWKAAGPSLFSEDDLKRFPFFVDLDRIRKQKQAIAKSGQKAGGSKESTESMRNLLGLVRAGGLQPAEKDRIFQGMSQNLREHPENVPMYLQLAKDSPRGSREANMMLGSLGFLGNPEAQKAMIEIYKMEDAVQDEKEKVLAELVLAPAAITPDTKEFLKEVYEKGNTELSQQAGFALGASLTRTDDPSLVSKFKKEFREAGDPEQKAYLLEVMGNAKKSVFRDEIQSALGSREAAVRAGAMDALRFSTDEPGRSLLLSAVQSERESSARMAGYRALQYQPYDSKTRSALRTCASSDPSDTVRSTCYDVLLSQVHDPETVGMIRSLISGERSELIRHKVNAALSN